MPIGINLLPKQKLVKAGLALKTKKILIAILVFYVVVILALLGVSFLTSKELSSAKTQRLALEKKIKENEKKEQLLTLLKDRLSKEEKIIADRIDYKRVFELTEGLAGEGTTLENLEISKGKLSFSGQTDDVFFLKDFLEAVSKATKDFVYAELASLARTKTGEYEFSLKTDLSF